MITEADIRARELDAALWAAKIAHNGIENSTYLVQYPIIERIIRAKYGVRMLKEVAVPSAGWVTFDPTRQLFVVSSPIIPMRREYGLGTKWHMLWELDVSLAEGLAVLALVKEPYV